MTHLNRSTSTHRRNSLRRACGFIFAAGSLFAVAQVAQAFTVSKVTGFSTDPTVDPTVAGNQAETICNASTVNGNTVESVAFNDDEPSPLIQYTATNRIVSPGYSGQGWSFRVRSAANPNPGWTHELLPTPSGWDLLWGDPSLASNPGNPSIVFMGTLAVPHAKFVLVSNQNGTPGTIQGVFTSSPSPLGGGCIARSLDGGQSFSVVGCVQDTTNVGTVGDNLGHFYDGSSMAVTQNGSGFSAFAAFIDTETNREAIWRMPDVTSNAANPFQPDNTLMGNVGSLPDDSLGEIETHVRLLASGSDLWKMSATFNSTSGSTGSSASGATSFEPAILKVNVRNRNGNAVGLASDAVMGEAVFFGNDAHGTALSMRTGPQFAYDIGTNEAGAPEMRFVYMAADTSGSTGTNFHLQGGFCPVNDLTGCKTVAKWISPPLNEAAALFPAIKFATVPGTGAPVWKVTFQGRTPADPTQLAIFAADLVRPDIISPSPTYNSSGLVLTQLTPFQTPCPDIRGGANLSNAGYWGDYDAMTFDAVTGNFVRSYVDSSLGCDVRDAFTSHNVHVSTVDIPAAPPVTFNTIELLVTTGGDDLRQDSDAHADIFAADNTTILQTVPIKADGDGSFFNGSVHDLVATLTTPVTAGGIGKVVITRVEHNSGLETDDNWDISALDIRLANGGSDPEACVTNLNATSTLQDGSTGVVRLSQNAGGSGVGPSATFSNGQGCLAGAAQDQIEFIIATGGDDLRGDSEGQAKVFFTGGGSMTVELKGSNNGSFDNNTVHVVTASLPAGHAPIDHVDVSLIEHDGFIETDDNWNIEGMNIETIGSDGLETCEADQTGDPQVRLTGSSGTKTYTANVGCP
jgi:hypothetical protein